MVLPTWIKRLNIWHGKKHMKQEIKWRVVEERKTDQYKRQARLI